MRLRLGELQEVVAIARHQQAVALVRKLEDSGIGRFGRKDVAQANDLMIEFAQKVRQILGNVLIEQESHRWSCASAIWRATSRSISPRLSS